VNIIGIGTRQMQGWNDTLGSVGWKRKATGYPIGQTTVIDCRPNDRVGQGPLGPIHIKDGAFDAQDVQRLLAGKNRFQHLLSLHPGVTGHGRMKKHFDLKPLNESNIT
jgi:hypothetical protein